MTKLLSATLVMTALLASPTLASERHRVTKHPAREANASSDVSNVGGRICRAAPHVGAFATAPWSDTYIPCEPN